MTRKLQRLRYELDGRELLAVLAGLRCLQAALYPEHRGHLPGVDELNVLCTDGGEQDCLRPREIDALCVRLGGN